MSSSSPVELNASGIIQRIEAGDYPEGVLANMAAGFLPLPQDELIAILAYLAAREGEIGETAQRSLTEIPARGLFGFAANESIPSEHLEMLMSATHDPAVLEALIRNRGVRDEAIADLARRADSMVQEVIVINQARILRAPQILDALEANPGLTAETRRRVLETREEFFDKKARLAPAVRAPEEVPEDDVFDELPTDDIADLLAKAEEQPEAEAAPTLPELAESEKSDTRKATAFSKILTMSVSQKVQLAFKGGKTERMILIRDRNKLVCSAVMRNPRINDAEVELIAGMRNIDEEVMRLISLRREWMAKYNIVLTMCRNPKVPVGVVLPLINRLTLRDLKGLKDDKGVPEVIRALARKVFVQRNQKT